ncbi:MAG: MFS transporter [Alphaproteobacteria bacterium]|nr:MFS transporter [Alphaproteobacteria bacterium]
MRKCRVVASRTSEPESVYAWWRLVASMALSTIGGVGMWCVVVALPEVQNEFGATRADASLAYTLTMIGFAIGGVLMGWLADRFRIALPLAAGAIALGLGFVLSGFAANLWQFALAQGLLVGIGTSTTFGPLIADVSLWFTKRRGIAVAICASGNYLAGTIWPPVVQHFMQTEGWRHTYIAIGLFCAATMVPLTMALRRRPPVQHAAPAQARTAQLFGSGSLGLSPNTLMILLSIAGVGCCVAMSMPQVHIVAYCGDLGYGVARGAEMLSVMLACGIVSRIASGFIADRIGGLPTLLLGSVLQGVALVLYLGFNGLTSLFVISGLFGLFQGGIVPSYAIIVREYFPAKEAGTRFGVVVMATLFGMALGGWMSGAIFDATGSYRAAFANGVLWNLLNGSIVLFLLFRRSRRRVALA